MAEILVVFERVGCVTGRVGVRRREVPDDGEIDQSRRKGVQREIGTDESPEVFERAFNKVVSKRQSDPEPR